MGKKIRLDSKRSNRFNKNNKGKGLLSLVDEAEFTPQNRGPRVKDIQPLTEAQRDYDGCIKSGQITFGTGPAGTGKTWFAAMRAAQALESKQIEKIIITRPAVEAGGERLGFLPGEMDEKYEPYLRPVKEAFEEFFGAGHLEYLIKSKKIEPIPLGFIRGATVKNAWLIADEMQNSSKVQMHMLLTRIGDNAKFIINGDPRQCDLPSGAISGLMDAVNRLERVGGCNHVNFTSEDVVRSGLCQKVVEAYEN